MKNVVLSLLLFVGLLLIALTTSSCGSSSPTEEGSGAVRFINAIPDYIYLEI